MKYFVDEEKRKASHSTCYFEFQMGYYHDKCWLSDSISISDSLWDEYHLSDLLNCALHKMREIENLDCTRRIFDGQFFDVEYYLLNGPRYRLIKERFVNVILKLMCDYHITIQWNGWIDKPNPEVIENAVLEIMENHSGTLNCLFSNEDMLFVFDWDCLNVSVYNPPEKTHGIFKQIAFSEGLFWGLSE